MQFARTSAGSVHIVEDAAVEPHAVRIAAALSGLIALLSLFLAARRLGGAMAAPLAARLLGGTAIFLLLWAWFVQCIGSRSAIDTTNRFTKLYQWAPFASLILVAYATSYPFTRPADWLVWLPTIAAAWLGPERLSLLPRHLRPALGRPPLANFATRESPETVLQQITRFRTAGGRDAIRGTLSAEFAPGERNATLYVAFCPPFDHLPEVSVDFHDERVAAVKLTQVLHNGAQLDVRLSHAAAAHSAFAIELFAAEPPPGQ
jgi:hypothetical protein